MSKIRFGLIGSGWRAEFYIRIAKALPEMFDLAAVMIRSKEKGEAFSAKFSVKVVNTLDELVEKEPEFVVMAIKRGIVTENLITLFERGIPVLTETPPGEDVEALHQLWDAYQKYQPKVQVAEQYFPQPLYASWYKAICDGKLGDVLSVPQDLPARGGDQAHDGLGQGGLAAAVGAGDDHKFVVVDGQVDAPENVRLGAVVLHLIGKSFQFQHR